MKRTTITKEVEHYRTSDWLAKRQRILVRDAYTCAVCGLVVSGRRAHVDHIVPLEQAGTDEDDNLQVLCDQCHGRKTRGEQRRRGGL
jgi:5-methylcytosine-specific restriction enzyme A